MIKLIVCAIVIGGSVKVVFDLGMSVFKMFIGLSVCCLKVSQFFLILSM